MAPSLVPFLVCSLLRPGKGAVYESACLWVCVGVCVSVCLSAREHISGTAAPIFTDFLRRFPVTVAGRYLGGVWFYQWLVVDETVDMLSRFKVTGFWLMAVLLMWILRLPPIFRGREKNFLKYILKPWLHTKLVCKFRGDPLKNGWDPLSRNLGPKPTNQ